MTTSDQDDFTPSGFIELLPGERPRVITPSGARRVPASESRPRLSAKAEARLAPADELSAQGYDRVDAAAEKLGELTKIIEDGAVTAELEIDDSLVIKLTKLVPP